MSEQKDVHAQCSVSKASYCALCDIEHELHEDAQGFHHVIKGERVACHSASLTPAASDDVASAQHDMIQQLHAELEQLKYGIAAVSFAMGWTDVCGKTNEEFARDLRRERDLAVSQVERWRTSLQKIADLIDAEDACEPLDDAIKIASDALTSTVREPK